MTIVNVHLLVNALRDEHFVRAWENTHLTVLDPDCDTPVARRDRNCEPSRKSRRRLAGGSVG